jgi:hypothetical protein
MKMPSASLPCEGAAAACAGRRRLDEDVGRAELDLVVMLARMQGVEVGDAIDAEDDGFAINDEPLLSGCKTQTL